MTEATVSDLGLERARREKAEEHAISSRLRGLDGQPLPVCSSSPRDLKVGGIGIALYVLFIEQMCLLFGILSICLTPIIVINYMGTYFDGKEQTTVFEKSTLANQISSVDMC